MAPPLAVETHDAHGPSGPPLHQLAIGAPAPRQNDDSIRLELMQGTVESFDIYFSAVGQFSLDRPKALLGKPVLVIQTADVSLLTRTKNHHVMLGPKVLHGRVDITGPVCPKECDSERPTKTSMRKPPGNLCSGFIVHVALQLSHPKWSTGCKRSTDCGSGSAAGRPAGGGVAKGSPSQS